ARSRRRRAARTGSATRRGRGTCGGTVGRSRHLSPLSRRWRRGGRNGGVSSAGHRRGRGSPAALRQRPRWTPCPAPRTLAPPRARSPQEPPHHALDWIRNARQFPPQAPTVPAAALLPLRLLACGATPPRAGPPPAPVVEVPAIRHPDGETPQWWYRSGAARAAANGAMQGRAKNVIVFLGDGMSLTTVAAARIFDGQRAGTPGEEHLLSWERFPHTAFSKTYNTDSQTPDSAGTMTAIA